MRRKYGANASGNDRDFNWRDWNSGERVEIPSHLIKQVKPRQNVNPDPFAHLGKIGYKKNTWSTSGPFAEWGNRCSGTHMKKSFLAEEMRRKELAESGFGCLDVAVDDDSVAGKAVGYYKDGTGPIRTKPTIPPVVVATGSNR